MTNEAKDFLAVKLPEYNLQTQEYNEAQVEFDKIKKQVTGRLFAAVFVLGSRDRSSPNGGCHILQHSNNLLSHCSIHHFRF